MKNSIRIAAYSIAASGLIAFSSSVCFARPTKDPNLFEKCPLTANLRVADPRTLSEFESLGACQGTIVSEPRDAVPADDGVVRILGVKAKPAPRGKRAAPPPPDSSDGAITTARWSGVPMRGLPMPRPFDHEVARAAAAYRIDPLFLHAIIRTESAYRPAVVSRAKAVGLMQIMPATGTTLGVRPAGLYEPATNIDAGARLLKRLQRRYGRDFGLILGAYNAGEGAVARYGNRVPPYRETLAYVDTVMGRYQAMRAAMVTTAGGAQ